MQTNQWRMDYVRPPYYDSDDDGDSDDEENHYDYDYPSDDESEPSPHDHPITKNIAERATEPAPAPPVEEKTPQQRAKNTRAEILKILGRK